MALLLSLEIERNGGWGGAADELLIQVFLDLTTIVNNTHDVRK